MESCNSSRPVVVVDDNPDDLFFFKRCLAKAGITKPLVEANDGEEVIALLKAMLGGDEKSGVLPPLIVFVDLKMPRVSGFDVLEWIRSRREFDAVPVAILSTSAEPRDVSRAFALGAQTYLVKHPTPMEMASAISAASGVTKAEDLRTLNLPGLARPV